jgi:hypothetical protein
VLLIRPIILLFLLSPTLNGQLRSEVRTFVQRAVPEGIIVFCGDAQAGDRTYELFFLRQHERRGIFIVGQADSTRSQIVYADTSLDLAAGQGFIPPEVVHHLAGLLAVTSPENAMSSPADPSDIYPIGAALNTAIQPIAGFMFRSNSTVEILRELQESDAIPIDPAQAPIGAILISPTVYSRNGPVLMGAVGILGLDRQVYEPDFGKGGFWAPRGTLNDWIKHNNSSRQLFGFLLRAHPVVVR